jgi:hypothetical protein
MALGSTKPLTEMSTRYLPEGKGRQARKADLTVIFEPIALKNVGASTFHNSMGLHDLLQGQLYLTFIITKGAMVKISQKIIYFKSAPSVLHVP